MQYSAATFTTRWLLRAFLTAFVFECMAKSVRGHILRHSLNQPGPGMYHRITRCTIAQGVRHEMLESQTIYRVQLISMQITYLLYKFNDNIIITVYANPITILK